jgi:dephospho-CoA kinase
LSSNSDRDRPVISIGLTGGIACGKSNALGHFRRLGTHVIDADVVARQVVAPGQPAHRDIVLEFGREILLDTGEIDRKRLGDLIFSNPQARLALNRIVHPRVLEEEARQISLLRFERSRLVVVDAALMIEVGSYRRYREVVVVFCHPEIQMRRLMRRDNVTEEQALARIRSQMSIYRKLTYADYVIDASGELANTREQIEHIHRSLLCDWGILG